MLSKVLTEKLTQVVMGVMLPAVLPEAPSRPMPISEQFILEAMRSEAGLACRLAEQGIAPAPGIDHDPADLWDAEGLPSMPAGVLVQVEASRRAA